MFVFTISCEVVIPWRFLSCARKMHTWWHCSFKQALKGMLSRRFPLKMLKLGLKLTQFSTLHNLITTDCVSTFRIRRKTCRKRMWVETMISPSYSYYTQKSIIGFYFVRTSTTNNFQPRLPCKRGSPFLWIHPTWLPWDYPVILKVSLMMNTFLFQSLVENSSMRLMTLAKQWEEHRKPLIEQYREMKALNSSRLVRLLFFLK